MTGRAPASAGETLSGALIAVPFCDVGRVGSSGRGRKDPARTMSAPSPGVVTSRRTFRALETVDALEELETLRATSTLQTTQAASWLSSARFEEANSPASRTGPLHWPIGEDW